jgi:hypothetical protein
MRGCRRAAAWYYPSLQRFQKLDEIVNLIRLEPKLRHVGVACDDAFGQRLFQRRDRIALMQRAERRRDFGLG